MTSDSPIKEPVLLPRGPICNVNHGGVCNYMVAGLKPNASTGPNTKAERH